jgi:RimJ/RimL family protein N-acetyltransferase
MNAPTLPLETPRLVVRRFEDRDASDILEFSVHDHSDSFRRRNIGWPLTEEGVLAWWTPMVRMRPEEATNWLALVIELKAKRKVIGNVGFNVKKVEDTKQGMIGWTLGKAFEGNGYVTEAATALLDYLFGTLGFHRVYASTSPENVKSWRLMERLGMRQEAHFLRNCLVDGTWGDEYLYAILAEEWLERRA